MNQFILSGKFINELGNYYQCEASEDFNEYTYSLAVIHSDPKMINETRYVWGICVAKECIKDSLLPLNEYIRSSKLYVGDRNNKVVRNLSNTEIEYIVPKKDLIAERVERTTALVGIVTLVIVSALLGIFGIVIEYTRLGNLKLSHEETNFKNIDIPIFQEGNTLEQLKQILLVKDELLRNSKSLWATIILCFSFTRNLRYLFYKFKYQPERVKHRNVMYFVWCAGFGWNILFVTVYLVVKTYPQNVWMLPRKLAHWTYAINHGGQMFGINMIYLAWGYIIAVNFLNFSNYIPEGFFESRLRPMKKPFPQSLQKTNSFQGGAGGADNQDIDGLDCVRVVNSDYTESSYYIKQQEFTSVVNIVRKYIRLIIPLLFAVLSIRFILPFLSDGPIYLVAIKQQFLIPCEGTWLLNLTLFQNLLHWSEIYDCSSCHPFIQDGFISKSCQLPPQTTVSSCKDACGQYLDLFANMFQFYLIAMFVMWLHKKKRRVTIALLGIVVVMISGVTFGIVFAQKIKANLFFDDSYMRYLVHRPWFRLPSFLMGMGSGLIVSRIHSSRRIIKFTIFKQGLMQVVGVLLCLASIFMLNLNNESWEMMDLSRGFDQPGRFNSFEAALYTSIAPLVFNIGLFLLLIPTLVCIKPPEQHQHKVKGDLMSLMMYDGWRVLYKIAQAAYICHYLVIFWYYASTYSSGLLLSGWVLLRVTFGSMVISFALGLIYYLLFDKPIRNIDRLVLFPSKISDSFLIKKHNKNSNKMKGTSAFMADSMTHKKSLSNESGPGLGFNRPTMIEGEQRETVDNFFNEDDESYSMESQEVSDDSEDEHTATLRRAQIIQGSMSILFQRADSSYNQLQEQMEFPNSGSNCSYNYQDVIIPGRNQSFYKNNDHDYQRAINGSVWSEDNNSYSQRSKLLHSQSSGQILKSSVNKLSRIQFSNEDAKDDPYYY